MRASLGEKLLSGEGGRNGGRGILEQHKGERRAGWRALGDAWRSGDRLFGVQGYYIYSGEHGMEQPTLSLAALRCGCHGHSAEVERKPGSVTTSVTTSAAVTNMFFGVPGLLFTTNQNHFATSRSTAIGHQSRVPNGLNVLALVAGLTDILECTRVKTLVISEDIQ